MMSQHEKIELKQIHLEEKKPTFQKFYQADRSLTRKHDGTGLDLSISKGIIESYGGKIEDESEGKNKITVFNISLPKKGVDKENGC